MSVTRPDTAVGTGSLSADEAAAPCHPASPNAVATPSATAQLGLSRPTVQTATNMTAIDATTASGGAQRTTAPAHAAPATRPSRSVTA